MQCCSARCEGSSTATAASAVPLTMEAPLHGMMTILLGERCTTRAAAAGKPPHLRAVPRAAGCGRGVMPPCRLRANGCCTLRRVGRLQRAVQWRRAALAAARCSHAQRVCHIALQRIQPQNAPEIKRGTSHAARAVPSHHSGFILRLQLP
jgi:hypothetical protein